MSTERDLPQLSEFMVYLAKEGEDDHHLPSLVALSRQLEISISTLREQLEVARALGLVEVRPKKGIRRLPYNFTQAVLSSLSYATTVDSDYFFSAFSDLRTHVETAYWHQAVSLLEEEDFHLLRGLITRAREKLEGQPIQIPHSEHRELHLSIYRRLNNPFVTGLLEAYWKLYEAVGLDLYTDLDYLREVWEYHSQMVDAICNGDANAGFKALVDHTDLLMHRTKSVS